MKKNENAATDRCANTAALIESSSLGTPEARALRESVGIDEAREVLRLADERRRTGMVGRWEEPADRSTSGRACARQASKEPASTRSVTVFESARETFVVTTVITSRARRWRLIGAAEGGAARSGRAWRDHRGSVVRVTGRLGVPATRKPVVLRVHIPTAAVVRRTYESVRRNWYSVVLVAVIGLLTCRGRGGDSRATKWDHRPHDGSSRAPVGCR